MNLDLSLNRLLIEGQVVVMMMMVMMVMVVGVHDHHDLRLCGKRICEAQKKNESKPELCHI